MGPPRGVTLATAEAMTTSSGLLSSRPRCSDHGLIVDDSGKCSRCIRKIEGAGARSLVGRAVVIALVVIAALLVYRVGGIVYEIVQARAGTASGGPLRASPVPAAQNGSRLVVYTTSSCGACRLAKSWMDERGVAYEERRVDSDDGARKELTSLGKGTVVPTFVVDEQVLTGFDVQGVRLTQALEAHGLAVTSSRSSPTR